MALSEKMSLTRRRSRRDLQQRDEGAKEVMAGGGRGGRAIGRNERTRRRWPRMEKTAGVCERRQLARVYTTALCRRRPHRAVLTRAERTFLFVRTPLSLSVSRSKVSLLSLSLSSLLPRSGKDNSPAFLSPSLLSSLLYTISSFKKSDRI